MTLATKRKLAEFLLALNKTEWAKQLLDDHEATENSLKDRNNTILELKDRIKYLMSRDRELIKLECQHLRHPDLNDTQQARYNEEVQAALRKTGKSSLSSMAFE